MSTVHELRAELAGHDLQAVVMGGSAGSIGGLLRILPALPGALAVPVLVVVHLPARSASRAAEVFADRTPLVVRDAVDKEEALPGLVLFAPADYHLLVERDGRVALSLDPPEHFSRPAIDVLFETASRAWGAHLLGVLFSGASEDGAAGLAAIVDAGGLGWVESPLTAEVPLMPAAGLRDAPGARALTIPEMVEALAALPVRAPAPADAGEPAMTAETRPAVAVLVVDDVEDNRVALKAFLEAEGIRAVLARSGAEALEALLVHDVALALIDVNMPGMNGFELAELMRGAERTRTIPIIFVTGVAGEPARVFKGYEAGAVDYLVKPVEPRLLKGKVETFVELHRQRHQLSDQLARLQEMLRLSDMFVAVLGHDLRGPLQSVELGAQVILGRPDDPAAVTKMANTMQRASRRMARLIEHLLDFARARLQGDIPIVPVACDLTELARSAISELEPAAAARVVLETTGDQGVTWDHDRIGQVLSNVLGNAAQHGAPNAPIVIAVAGDADRVAIEIRNQGTIPPEMLPMLFDPFTRAETRRQGASGLGLGLYIVDQLVKAHGGVVRVESSDGSTSFASSCLGGRVAEKGRSASVLARLRALGEGAA